jgi:hypothetical protein
MSFRWLVPVVFGIIAAVALVSYRQYVWEAFEGGADLLRDELIRLSEP